MRNVEMKSPIAVLVGILCLAPSWKAFAVVGCTTGAGGNQKTASDPCVGTPANVGSNFCTPTSASTWTCTCASGWISTGGSTPSCQDFNACTQGSGNTACKTSSGGNTCTDASAPSLSWTCTCGNPQYVGTGTTSCYIGCTPTNHCRDSGDSAAACTDTGSGYSCMCDAAFVFNGTSCVDACPGTTDPCGSNGTCTAMSVGWTCSCNSGYVSTGGSTPSCVDFNACTQGGGDTACKTGSAGNSCTDLAPPSLSYTCTCGNAAYEGTGTTSCYIGCTPTNHCRDSGDAAALCTDTGSGYTCTCDAGFMSNGTTCVSDCPGSTDPCGNGGSCTATGAGTWSCSCPIGYVSTGGTRASCVAVVCGDSVVNGPEQCDEGAANGTAGSCCDGNCMFVGSGTQCLAPTGPCDDGASCTGSAATCPAHSFKPATTVCASANDCKQAASCTGSSDACPAQANVSDGTSCSAGNGACAAGVCVPLDLAAPPLDLAVADMSAPASDDLSASGAPDMATAPGAGGCGCMVGATSPSVPLVVCVLFALLFAALRRRS